MTFTTGDGEFASLEQFTNLLMGAPWLNLMSANKHKPFIEHRIHVVKERVRSIRHSLPFQTIPKGILMHMVFYAVKLLNYFPVRGDVSEVYGPKTIMSGEVLDFKKFSIPFGSYCNSTRRNSRTTAWSIVLLERSPWVQEGMPRVGTDFLHLTRVA